MKKLAKILSYSSVCLLLMACGEITDVETDLEEPNESVGEDFNDEDEHETNDEETTDEDSQASDGETGTDEEEGNLSEETVENDPLANYSEQEIEYARVWLEVQGFTDMDQLNVQFTEAGTPVHPQIEEITEMEAPVYPEDVIQLTGNAGVHGMVTYSGNGDGTINVYAIPYRLPYPEEENWEELVEMYEEWVENPELVHVDVHENEDVIELIEKIHYSD